MIELCLNILILNITCMGLLIVPHQELVPLRSNWERNFLKKLYFNLCRIEHIKNKVIKWVSMPHLEFITVKLNVMSHIAFKNCLLINNFLHRTNSRPTFYSTLFSIPKSRPSIMSQINKIKKDTMSNKISKNKTPRQLWLFLRLEDSKLSMKTYLSEYSSLYYTMSLRWNQINRTLKITILFILFTQKRINTSAAVILKEQESLTYFLKKEGMKLISIIYLMDCGKFSRLKLFSKSLISMMMDWENLEHRILKN